MQDRTRTRTTTPNHTPSAAETLRPNKFTSYSDYVRWLNNQRDLPRQREILAAIVFEESAGKLMMLTSPDEFDDRNADDWMDDVGTYQRIAIAAFEYWEVNGKPPQEEIEALLAGDERALSYLAHLYQTADIAARVPLAWFRGFAPPVPRHSLRPAELEQGSEQTLPKPRPIVFKGNWNDESCDEPYNEEKDAADDVSVWIESLVRSIANYRAWTERKTARPAERREETPVREEERQEEPTEQAHTPPLRRRDQVKALAREGKTQTEIATQMGISQAAVSKILSRSTV